MPWPRGALNDLFSENKGPARFLDGFCIALFVYHFHMLPHFAGVPLYEP